MFVQSELIDFFLPAKTSKIHSLREEKKLLAGCELSYCIAFRPLHHLEKYRILCLAVVYDEPSMGNWL
jgi:hypothetical protein